MKNVVIETEKCTGCTACRSACPKSAIDMKEGYDGFLYPNIEESKCINCGLCKKICPIINFKENGALNKCYIGCAKDEDVRFNSSSGGIFTLVANYVLKNSGIVIGAAFDKSNKLKHIAITNNEDLVKLRGSKYLQSNLNNIFAFIDENIRDKKILFVGTPCQVAGLKSFIKNDFNNLLCIDIICHGTPSPKLFSKYVKELESKNGKLYNYNFRDKLTGWESYSNTMIFKDKNISEIAYKNNYMKLFLSNIALRRSCYNCKFKLGNKYSDITLGDFWGVKKYYPEMYDKRGVSCIIINTPFGLDIFKKINDKINYKECKIDEILNGNPSLNTSCILPQNREEFFNEIDYLTIDMLVKKYVSKESFWLKLKRLLK